MNPFERALLGLVGYGCVACITGLLAFHGLMSLGVRLIRRVRPAD